MRNRTTASRGRDPGAPEIGAGQSDHSRKVNWTWPPLGPGGALLIQIPVIVTMAVVAYPLSELFFQRPEGHGDFWGEVFLCLFTPPALLVAVVANTIFLRRVLSRRYWAGSVRGLLLSVVEDISPDDVCRRIDNVLAVIESERLAARWNAVRTVEHAALPLGVLSSALLKAQNYTSQWDQLSLEPTVRERWMDELRSLLQHAAANIPEDFADRLVGGSEIYDKARWFPCFLLFMYLPYLACE